QRSKETPYQEELTMGVDLEQMRKAREEKQRGADFFTFDEVDTVFYLAPPCREDDLVNFIELKQHRGKNKNDRSFICLTPDINKILTPPAVIGSLREQGKDIEGGCPQCDELSSGRFRGSDEELKRAKPSSRWFWNIIPIKHRRDARVAWT